MIFALGAVQQGGDRRIAGSPSGVMSFSAGGVPVERFARMAAWQARRDPAASQQDIQRQVLDYMATMPAWRDHPRVQAR